MIIKPKTKLFCGLEMEIRSYDFNDNFILVELTGKTLFATFNKPDKETQRIVIYKGCLPAIKEALDAVLASAVPSAQPAPEPPTKMPTFWEYLRYLLYGA